MDNSTPPVKPEQKPVFAVLSLATGIGMAFAMAVGITGGLVHGWKGQVAMLILATIIICAGGTSLAIISLVWRKENRTLGQYALWLNGMLAFFGFPVMVFWLLSH